MEQSIKNTYIPTNVNLKGKRIVVSGAGGFIGSSLIKKLLQCEAIVLGIDISGNRLEAFSHKNLTLKFVDLKDKEICEKSIINFSPSIFYHLASHPDNKETYEQIIKGPTQNLLTINTLEAFSKCENRSIYIYGDTSKVYGKTSVPYYSNMAVNPICSYAIAKNADFQYCKLFSKIYNFKVLSVRPTMIYGPNQAFNLITFTIKSVLENQSKIILNGGKQTRAPLYIDDAINAYIAAQNSSLPNQIAINIGGEREIPIIKIVMFILELMNSQVPVIQNDNNLRLTEMNRSTCNNSDANKYLSWYPEVSLETGLKQTIDYFISHKKFIQ